MDPRDPSRPELRYEQRLLREGRQLLPDKPLGRCGNEFLKLPNMIGQFASQRAVVDINRDQIPPPRRLGAASRLPG